ncbi:hypothetical protein RFI_20392, partial [Reticulomyxa filosa]
VKYNYVSKLDKSKSIAKKRLQYYEMGGRVKLKLQRRIELSSTVAEFERLDKEWEDCLNKWKSDVSQLRQKHPGLTFFTGRDMRFLCDCLQSHFSMENKEKYTGLIASKIAYIHPDISMAQINEAIDAKTVWWISETERFFVTKKKKKNKSWNVENDNELEQLGKMLKNFESYWTRQPTLSCSRNVKRLEQGKPNLYICETNKVLEYLVKLFLSQQQQPIANRVIFCDQSTSVEQLECFLIRSNCQALHNSKETKALYCLALPEQLQPSVQRDLLRMLQLYTQTSLSLFAIITTNNQCIVAEALLPFRDREPLILEQAECRSFYSTIFCSELSVFRENTSNAPFVQVFLSKSECVGKSHTIAKIAKSLQLTCDECLVHLPLNTTVADVDFIVDRLLSAPQTDGKLVFHINISSQAGQDVNIIMFQLLVLRHLTKSDGTCFRVCKNHMFLVELPTELSNTHKKTRLTDVLKWLYFFGDGVKDLAMPFFEVLDQLKDEQPLYQSYIINKLSLSSKEQFVVQYLDALETGLLKNNAQQSKDWSYESHIFDEAKLEPLLKKYSPPARQSLIHLKSFLQFMYKQLIQVYNFLYIKNAWVPTTITGQALPLHEMIVTSIIKSGTQIACDTYQRNKRKALEDCKDMDEDKKMDESMDTEEFFLVQMWKHADPPMVLLNQMSISDSVQTHMEKSTLKEDLDNVHIDHSLSLLSMNVDKNQHEHAKVWRYIKQLHKWEIYNFEQELEKKTFLQRTIVSILKTRKPNSKMLASNPSKQTHKKRTNDENKRKTKVEQLLKKHNDYALTFDNILKIVAIFFRLKSSIPVLIMGETAL